jgi:hypothetical protein
MFDAAGNMSRPWLLWFQQLLRLSVQSENISSAIIESTVSPVDAAGSTPRTWLAPVDANNHELTNVQSVSSGLAGDAAGALTLNQNALRFGRAGQSYVDQTVIGGTTVLRGSRVANSDTIILEATVAGLLVSVPIVLGGLELDSAAANFAAIRAGIKSVSGALQYTAGSGAAVSSLVLEGNVLNFYTGASSGAGAAAALATVLQASAAGMISAGGLRVNVSGANSVSPGSFGTVALEGTPGSPVSGRLSWGTDDTGWTFRIAKNKAGVITDMLTFKDAVGASSTGVGGRVGVATVNPAAGLHVNTPLTVSVLTAPGAPVITVNGAAGATTYSYSVAALQLDGSTTAAGTAASTTTGNATLTGLNFNALTWAAVTDAYAYRVYRTAGGATQGAIAVVLSPALNDTGLVASGAAPVVNTTGATALNGTLSVTGASTFIGNVSSGSQWTSTANYIHFFQSANASWRQFALYESPGASAALDTFNLAFNTRSSSGGVDNFTGNALSIASQTGALTFGTSATFAGAAVFSAPDQIALGSGWLNWTPTVSASGAMTVSGLTINDAQYLRLGPLVFFKIFATMTLAGTAASALIMTLPLAIAGFSSTASGQVHQAGGTWAAGATLLDNAANTVRLSPTLETNYALGSTLVMVEGFYRCS